MKTQTIQELCGCEDFNDLNLAIHDLNEHEYRNKLSDKQWIQGLNFAIQVVHDEWINVSYCPFCGNKINWKTLEC